MKWRKLGRIFEPSREPTLPGCTEFAQSPQTLVFDNFVRVYFSTREREATSGKFLSHVSFVDFRPDFQVITNRATTAVLPLGGLGCFDEHGIFPFNVLRVGDKIFGYSCGWSRRVSVSVETSIGLAISDDEGLTFRRHGDGPVMSSSLHEPCLVGDAFVRKFNGIFHMWYIFGKPWRHYAGNQAPDRVYKIAHATSADGIHWCREEARQIIDDVIGDDECQALPSVLYHNGRFHMYFCFRFASGFRSDPERGYRLGYATSNDLQSWKRDDAAAGITRSSEPDAWDANMMCYPHVFEFQGDTWLLYNGNEFGRHGFGLAIAE